MKKNGKNTIRSEQAAGQKNQSLLAGAAFAVALALTAPACSCGSVVEVPPGTSGSQGEGGVAGQAGEGGAGGVAGMAGGGGMGGQGGQGGMGGGPLVLECGRVCIEDPAQEPLLPQIRIKCPDVTGFAPDLFLTDAIGGLTESSCLGGFLMDLAYKDPNGVDVRLGLCSLGVHAQATTNTISPDGASPEIPAPFSCPAGTDECRNVLAPTIAGQESYKIVCAQCVGGIIPNTCDLP